MRTAATNIEHDGYCPDCEHLERQLDKERGRHQQDIEGLQGQYSSLVEENRKLREALKRGQWLMGMVVNIKELSPNDEITKWDKKCTALLSPTVKEEKV